MRFTEKISIQIIREIHSENCFDGTFIKEYKLDSNIGMNFIEALKKIGNINVLKSLENPFFSFNKEGYLSIKGILNDDEIKVIYVKKNMETSSKFLFNFIKNLDNVNINSNE